MPDSASGNNAIILVNCSFTIINGEGWASQLCVTFVALEVARLHHSILFVTDGFGLQLFLSDTLPLAHSFYKI